MYLGAIKTKMYSIAKKISRTVSICVLLLGVFVVSFALMAEPAKAVTGINQQLNFQGRLFNSQGAAVPDGYYNVEFKIYQDGDGLSVGNPGGTLKWTEDHLNANSQGVTVKNGFMSVDLGSITAFGSNVDWNQSVLWLSVNIGSTDASCTPFSSCTPDGEMIPMKRMSSTTYALNSGQLGGLTSTNFVQIAQGVQTDASTNTNSIYINKTGTGNLITLQSSGSDAFTVSNSGDLSFGANANHTLSVATAGTNTVGKTLTITAGTAGTGASTLAGGDLSLQGGTGGGTNGAGGNVNIDGGTKNGSGADGSVYIGVNHTASVQIGSTATTNTQNIYIGTNNTGGSTTNVTIGSGSSAAGGSTTVQSKGNMSMTAGGTLTESSSGNASLSSTAGTLGLTGNGNTTLSSTTGTVGITSSGATTVGTNGSTRATFDTSYAMYFGAGVTGAVNPFTLSATGGTAGVAGSALTVQGGTGGSSSAGGALTIKGGSGGSTSGAGGALTIQGGGATAGNSNGGDLTMNAGLKNGSGTDGNIYLGSTNTNTVQVGNAALSAGTQTINIGTNNTSGGTTNVTIGSASGATGGTTNIQAKGNIGITSAGGNISETATAGTWTVSASGNVSVTSTAGTLGLASSGNTSLSTNSVVRATFDTANGLYLGNGVTAAAPNNFTLSGTGSSTTAVVGGALTIQGGNATVGNANGGNITIAGGTGIGTGVNGVVIINSPTFSTTSNDANCYTGGALVANSCTITATSVNNTGAVIVGFSTTGKTATLPDPSNTTAGRIVYVTAANGTQDFSLSVNGGGVGNIIAMRQNTTATMIWNGADWTAAGASSSTTLQSAYDNTIQSAGGAELVVSHTGTTNGLTIRDSSTNPVNGTLLSVQTSSAATLFSVNSNVTEYSTDSGAEVAGASSSTFPASTWANIGASTTVSRYTTAGNYIATGQASVSVATPATANNGVSNTLSAALTANMHYNVSFSARLASGTFTDMNVYYSIDGSTASIACTTSQAVVTSIWTKVNCAFATPSSGITTSNAILIRQTGATSRTFYVDNLSVTIAADYNYATDGGVDDAGNFATNWSFVNATSGAGSVSRNTSDGYDASDSAGVTITTGAANAGIRNKLSMNPLTSTLYRISVYAKLSSGSFTDFKVRYSRDGSTGSSGNYVNCVDYNTQTITTSAWTKITCYITTDSTAATNPYVNFVEDSSATRTWYVDAFSMTLAQNTTPNVQIGSGVNGGPATLFTLDRSASAPVAANMDSLLGSMYYDTALGKLQCYEADGWGACGSSPDNIVTISPEYTNAVMHGTGVGTMTSDLCSSTLGINDGSSGQPTICGSNETYNFYKWTSPQASAQTYSIYVTYQLPGTFKEFASGQTSLMGRTDSSNSTVQYQIYRSDSSSGLVACGSAITVSTGSQTSWQFVSASGASDPSTCSFTGGNSIVFKISATASQNANAYIGNLNFTFSNT